ncbi:hypothetical protein [Serratia entomophila]|uniref:hypothetical protein n=1 Tax=Serratia entomophila TaxID=42906 RepID=UPI0021BAE8FF|nr:hypothetical protein [Serratia entomophila]
MKASSDDSIENRIVNYRKYIDTFRSEANTHGIWLFIATLGCWGVTQPIIRLIATFVLLFIFFYLIDSKKEEKRPFQIIESEIEELINVQFNGDEKKARLYDLNESSNYRRSVRNILKSSPLFLVCYTFYIISLIYFIYTLSKI